MWTGIYQSFHSELPFQVMIYSPTFSPVPLLFYPAALAVSLGEAQMLHFSSRAVWSDQEVSVEGNILSLVAKTLNN